MSKKPDIQAEPAKKAILLVEDEALIAVMEMKMLQRNGYMVLKASSGEKAIELVEAHRIDLVLMDINLGVDRMDGTETAQRILQTHDLPVIFLTSYADQEMVNKVKGITRYGYILKNSGEFVLIESISMAFELFEAHRKTKENEAKYRAAFITSPEAGSINSLDGRYVDINEGFTKLTGYNREETIGLTSSGLGIWVIPADRERLLRETRENGYIRNLESTFRTRDGCIKTGMISARIISINGEPHLLSITRDITEKKKILNDLELSRERLDIAAECMSEGLWDWNLRTGEAFHSDRFATMLGYQPDDLPYTSAAWSDLLHPDDREEAFRRVDEYLSGTDNLYESSFRMKRKDGSYRWIVGRGKVIRNGEGSPERFIGFNTDITEQMELDQKKSKSQAQDAQYKDLFESSPEGIILLTLTGKILDVNQAFIEMTGGYTCDDFVGKHFLKIPTLHSQSIGTYINLFGSIVAGNTNSTLLFDFRHKSGEMHTCEARFRIVRKNGSGTRIIQALLRDISDNESINNLLKVTNTRLKTILDGIPAEICIYDPYSSTVLFMNRNMRESFGEDYTGESYDKVCENLGRPIVKWKPPPFTPEDTEENHIDICESFNPAQGSWLLYSSRVLNWTDGTLVRLQIAMDITKQKRQEDLLTKTVREKEFLMKELNHRVKNHLLMVSSLIKLKEKELGPGVDLSDLTHQIDAIRILHEKLQSQTNVSRINFKIYIEELLESIFASSSQEPVESVTDMEDVMIHTRNVIPIGLIINEIATNAVKHGFIPDRKAVFSVRLEKRDSGRSYLLTLGSSGNLVPETVGLENPDTLGLRLVSALVAQINGSIEIQREPVQIFRIQFPEEQEDEEPKS